MKKIIFSLALLASASYAFAQVPNPSFENWTSGEVDGWQSDNINTYIPVTQSNQAHAGNSAVKLSVVFVDSTTNTSGGIATSFATSSVLEGDSLVGWYKGSLLNGDQFVVSMIYYSGGTGVAFAMDYIGISPANYTRFAVGVLQIQVATIDSISMQLAVGNTSVQPDLNSFIIVDDLHLGSSASGIQEHQNAMNISVFPNPTSSSINFTAPEQSTLELYSVDGQLLLSEIVAKGNTQLDLADLPEGILVLVLRNDKQLFRQEIVHSK